ncbi:MAG: alpha/beta hydrolase [Bacteroidetes bacterium]|nr:alpha/beta hydrolase [Bacteroidota bacterium]
MIYHFKEVPIFYEVTGKGPVMVLLHGFLESSTMWKAIAPPLTKHFTVITIDLPGHGKSGVLSETHSMELMAQLLFSMLHHLKIETATLVGHSMGGYVALAFTELYQQHTAGLILLNSTTYKDNDNRKKNRDRALRYIKTQKDSIISMAISNLFTEKSRLQYASEIEQLKLEALSFPLKGITAAIKGMRDRKDRTQVLQNFQKKKWIICGDKDPIVPLEDSTRISEVTHTPIKILRSSHMSWMENTDKIVKILHFNE